MERTLQPELLDTLSPTHPDAAHNRRDLRLTNAIMRNFAWFRRELPGLIRPGERVLEIGAGDGTLGRELHAAGVRIDGLDLWPRPPKWPADSAWHVSDLRTFAQWDRYAIVIGNLIFHQFGEAELHELGQRLKGARVIVACEPTRRRSSQVAYAAIGPLLGANHVSLHDAHVSIAAGFRGAELPRALGLSTGIWSVCCFGTFIGAYRMIARRPA